jgi:CHAT domain-containing protein
LIVKMRVCQAQGLALAAIGDLTAAAHAFQQAIAFNQQTISAIPSWLNRIPVLEAAAPSYRGLTQIQLLQDRDPAAALRTWNTFRPGAESTTGLTITLAVLPRGIVVWRSLDGAAATARWVDAPVEKVLHTSEAFERLIVDPSSDEQELNSLGSQLFHWLLGQDLESVQPGSVRVNADSWLAGIPLGALKDKNGGYALQHWSFLETYGSDRSDPAERAIPPGVKPSERALIVAAPSVVTPSHLKLPFLTAAVPEARAVAAHFRNSVVIQSPSFERFWEAQESATILHFVGHGWGNRGGGGIVVGATPDSDSVFLTSRDLAAHDWSHCRLVVLSACLTASGLERRGVNNETLVQALLGAGVGHVVAARWSVDSEATRVLMEGFYTHLLAGVSVSEALTRSASDVSARPEWKHPYYWAGFEVFGRA